MDLELEVELDLELELDLDLDLELELELDLDLDLDLELEVELEVEFEVGGWSGPPPLQPFGGPQGVGAFSWVPSGLFGVFLVILHGPVVIPQ